MKERKHLSLSIKFIIGLMLVGICIMVGAIVVGATAYKKSITKNYNTTAYQVAKTALGYFTQEEIAEYAKLTYDYNHGNVSNDQIQEVISSNRYQEITKQLDNLRTSMEANDIFVFVFDIDILENYDAIADETNDWTPLYYIMDSYPEKEYQMKLGDAGPIYKEYIQDSLSAYKTGVHSDNYFISEGQYGYNTAAMYPVVQNGKTVAFVSVEIPMETLESDVTTYVKQVVIVVGATTLILLLLAVVILIRTLVRPIELVSKEAGQFVKNNNEISTKLQTIQTHDEVQTLSESLLSMQIGIREYIENIKLVTAEKERIGAELGVATQIQADMLPSIFPAFPERHEFDIHATMTPAKEVGGDFYDFFLIDENHLALVMADVSGKGVPAALFMMISKTLIKSAAQTGLSPKEILEQVNNQLCENNEAEMFVTVWIGIMEISSGQMICANAGHEYPAIKRKNGSYELFKDKHGLVLAGMEGSRYREYELQFEPGDAIFVYTDGVPEATSADNELYGTDRMIEALNQAADIDCEKLLQNVHKDVDAFVGEAPQFDDITMLSVTYIGNEARKA